MELTENKKMTEIYKERARRLISRMTLEEKVMQTMNSAPAIPRLGIKAYDYSNEALHGVARAGTATVFPQVIGLAATFDEELMEQVGDAVSTEARGKYNMQQSYDDTDTYKGLTFWAPNVNIFRDPRWGRGHETFGEDPWLTGRMAMRYIRGLQGHDEHYLKTAACAKHFAVHSGPEDLRHEFNAEVSVQDLYETYLPAFRTCVREGRAEAVMGAYNRTNGEACCGSRFLLTGLLRETWGFDGHVVSDCGAVKDFYDGHMVVSTPAEAAALGINSGCDLECGHIYLYLIEAVKQGLVTEEAIDEAVVRLFTTRMKLGFFDKDKGDNPYDSITYDAVDTPAMQELNLTAARESIVLLKNEDSLLPLSTKRYPVIGVIGPNANSRTALVGNYEGTASRYVTVLEGIQDFVKGRCRVLYSEGCHLYKDRVRYDSGKENDRLSEVKAVCAASDAVVVCLGLDALIEGEEATEANGLIGGDKKDLKLPGLQQSILETACDSGKPVILVMLSGSAMDLSWADRHVPAILQGWYPGAAGGRAIADILFGTANPEGRLPITFYRNLEELPAFTDYSMKGRTYRYMRQEALYPFGYGLSYTCCSYAAPRISGKISPEGLTVRFTLTNEGERAYTETVQVYIKRCEGDTPNAQLKDVRKVHLAARESREVEFVLPEEAFGLYDEEGIFRISPGEYRVYIGGSQPDARSIALTGMNPLCLQVRK
ncbi:glycoside hydrolase family 3 C-terminal domain-containing protein [Lachnotalea sp. AF33-28]|uniref:glycoside hydrolase family 3 C-terminal domain-containing protein n=1 Tax=Lachnotalea sp. AF33-28 TaxID=2292046 RepID=UPI000E51D182|nr:glycoside hydrolase family 3 C-terminal domain-containing protein [Lachnotalea sp. AF33-28]RHP33928.1 glycoside hydrolase family 3 protein [Lachnotalea sp. AF33-28]